MIFTSTSVHSGTSMARQRMTSGTAARRVIESVEPWMRPVATISWIHVLKLVTPEPSNSPQFEQNSARRSFVLSLSLIHI